MKHFEHAVTKHFERAVTRAYWSLKPLKRSFMANVLPYVAIWVLVLAAALLSGCTMYTVEKTADSTKVTVMSSRVFEAPELHYERKGNDAVFDFGAASATNSTALENIGAAVIQQLLGRVPTTETE